MIHVSLTENQSNISHDIKPSKPLPSQHLLINHQNNHFKLTKQQISIQLAQLYSRIPPLPSNLTLTLPQPRSHKPNLSSPHLNLIPLRQKGIKPQNQIIIPPKQSSDPINHAHGIYLLGLEALHNFEEFVVDAWSAAEF